MFEIDENDLPFVRTRQALLVIDLQNDFVSSESVLAVKNPPGFLDNITNIVSRVRPSGDIIWVRSVFEASRRVNEAHADSEKVITEKDMKPRQRRRRLSKAQLAHDPENEKTKDLEDSARLTDIDEKDTPETFLTLEPGQNPLLHDTSLELIGMNHPSQIMMYVNSDKDIFWNKSYYSAFKDGSLVQTLRGRFVTEIYICGVLTNMSVFATAMDAARFGYQITIIEDCLGYRSKARHDEALKQLRAFTGCNVMSSDELIDEIQEREMRKARQSTTKKGQHKEKKSQPALENLMGNLKLEDSSSATKVSSVLIGSAVNVADDSKNEGAEKESQLSSKVPVEGRHKERVKATIKTRRHRPKSSKDSPSPENKNPASSPTASVQQKANVTLAEPKETPLATRLHKSESSSSDSTESMENKQAEAEASGYEADEQKDVEEAICEGDTKVIHNLLPEELADGIFERIRDEVLWQKMSHRGGDVPRLISVQGSIAENGSIPIYRHPADESPPLLPFSPTILLIKSHVEKKLGHPVNHVLIQFYRDGSDYISEHSDKTLDIIPDTFICNVSLGAQRTMVFRTKKPLKGTETPDTKLAGRRVCRAPLPHNSMCKMGLVTNMRWLHGIRQDKRLLGERSEAELAFGGRRISLTFRNIGTFLDKTQQKIWGQGATAKIREDAKTVINGETAEAEAMIREFGNENHASEFDWAAAYGKGFDVLHISNSPKLFLSGDAVTDMRVKLMLSEYGIAWTEGTISPPFSWKNAESPPVPEKLPIKFVDNDLSKSTVQGYIAIMLYLDAVYGPENRTASRSDLARIYTRFQQADRLLEEWRAGPFNVKTFRAELAQWNDFAKEAAFIAGPEVSIADFALYPVIIELRGEEGDMSGVSDLLAWGARFSQRPSAKKVDACRSGVREEKAGD